MSSQEFSNSYLLEQGIVLLIGPIDSAMAQAIICQLQYLSTKYPNRPIQLWINSPGGEVQAGMAIYDVINYIKPEVHTIAMGLSASMAAFLLSSGTKGKRCALPNSEILIHQPFGGTEGKVSDIMVYASFMSKIKSKMNQILSRNTGQNEERIAEDTERDYILSAQEAVSYGLIDNVIKTVPKAWN